MSRGNIYIPYNATAMLCTYDLVTVEYQVHHCWAMSAHRRFGGALQGKVSITMSLSDHYLTIAWFRRFPWWTRRDGCNNFYHQPPPRKDHAIPRRRRQMRISIYLAKTHPPPSYPSGTRIALQPKVLFVIALWTWCDFVAPLGEVTQANLKFMQSQICCERCGGRAW